MSPENNSNPALYVFLVPGSQFFRAKASVCRQIGRLFCCLKGFRRVFTRFKRIDAILPGLVFLAGKMRLGVSTP